MLFFFFLPDGVGGWVMKQKLTVKQEIAYQELRSGAMVQYWHSKRMPVGGDRGMKMYQLEALVAKGWARHHPIGESETVGVRRSLVAATLSFRYRRITFTAVDSH